MNEPIISVSGLRGVVGRGLSPLVAIRYACAFAAQLGPGPVIVSRDGRASGVMLTHALQAGLIAAGRDVIDAHIAATPTTGILVQALHAAGAIQISASHNPVEYNGLKLFDDTGRVVPAVFGERVLAAHRRDDAPWASVDRLGHASISPIDAAAEHWARVAAIVDVERIRRRKFTVLLDANHGAGSLVGARVLRELGCAVQVLGALPDGMFEHPPEPTEENLASVRSMVTAMGADIGFCQDPDADRLAVMDEKGRYLGEEYTLALCVEHVLRQQPGPVVTNCSTSRMAEDLARQYGVPFTRTKVGEAHVVDAMLSTSAVIGGEGNGGVIDPRVGMVRDSFVGMALILDAMAQRDAPVSTLAGALPSFAMVKRKLAFPAHRLEEVWTRLREEFGDATVSRPDGMRLDWPDGWLLVRPSNTEPLLRVIAEAITAQVAEQRCGAACAVLSALAATGARSPIA